MDSSSIVSFNNESTYQAPARPDYNNISVHELALHAMRDRCLLLQRRINVLENDNMRLKLDITKTNSSETSPYVPLQDDDKFTLQQKIAELTKQKSHLMNHVFMVSCENKNLWTKIATIKTPEKVKECTKAPLLRTNTYIQSTPKTSANYQDKFSETSLEEISLKLINSYIQEKSQLVEQYEQMTQLQDNEEILNLDSIGFAYIEDPATDSLKEIRNQTEKLQLLKQEIAQQEADIKLILAKVEAAADEGYKCPSCVANSSRVITSENKEIETSDSLADWETPADSNMYNNTYNEINTTIYQKTLDNAVPFEKICPMCGQTFQRDVEFNEFQSHVESHFTGEPDPDSIVDNFDNIPNSFDNNV